MTSDGTQTEETRRQAAGELRGVPDGERTNGTAATDHTAGRRSGGKAGREGGERDTDGHAPGERRRDQGEAQAAGRGSGREQTDRKKRYINI